ncbi:MAG: fatty-acyl-CoA synthase, partial [Acidimicrobiaceae bacterium]|nr:fatty-acyl-CoA synthase [Acidimicrobiaceae bacterium]
MTTSVDISLGRWFAERARRSPKRRALSFEGATLTYADLLDRVDRLAAAFRAGGLCHGDRVGFLGLNQPAFFETLLAAARLGAIFVPLNFRLTGAELVFIVGDAGVHTLVVDEQHSAVIDQIRDDLPVRRYVGADHGGPGQAWERLADLIAGHQRIEHDEPIDPDEVACIMYTSGTTGRPKGAMLTHANFWWNNTNALHLFDVLESDVSLVVAPLFHIGGLNVTTLVTWQKGGEVVLHRSFDPGACLTDIPKYGVTTMFGVPAMFLFMSQHPGFDNADLTSVRTLICGGAPVPEPLIKVFNGRGIPIQQGYGLTETAPSVTFLTAEWGLAKLGSAGQTPLFTEVRLVDNDGAVVTGARARGEVCVKGPNVMKGYWNRPDATAAAIDPDGWFHTGDVGYLDEDGFLFIADRVKDMVITGGENVYPAEIESVLYEHPAVAEVAVIGLPDERWGEAV